MRPARRIAALMRGRGCWLAPQQVQPWAIAELSQIQKPNFTNVQVLPLARGFATAPQHGSIVRSNDCQNLQPLLGVPWSFLAWKHQRRWWSWLRQIW